MGIDPRTVEQIVLASQNGVGSMDFTAVGDFTFFRQTFPKKDMKDKIWEVAASVYLRLFHQE